MTALSKLIANHAEEPTCNLHWIGRQLGWDYRKRSSRTLEDFVSGLIEFHGFPKPLPHRKHGGAISCEVSYTHSAWIRIGVINWLGDFLPPDASISVEAEAEAAAADEMDRAAEGLFLVAGTDLDRGAA